MTRLQVRLFTILYSLFTISSAAQFVSEPGYTLPAEETRIGDIYFGGTMLRIEGRLDGSAIAGAQSVNVSGPVTRNLFLAAQSVDVAGAVAGDVVTLCATLNVSGRVGGAVRAGAGTIYINGAVGQDVLAGCANLVIGKNSEVRGDVAAGCRSLEIAGTVRGDVKAVANEIVISGSIDGDVDVTVADKLTLTPDARIYGNLRYRSNKKIDIGNPDMVFGNIDHVLLPSPKEIEDMRDMKPRPGTFVTFFLPFTILSIFGALVVGFLLVAIWKHALNEGLARSLGHWGRTVGFGAIGFLIGPMSILVAFALIITIPAGLIAAAAYLVSLYLAKILAGLFTGRLLFRIFGAPEISLWWAAPVGIVIVFGLCAIPYAGWAIWLASMAVGFGVIAELLGMSRTT
ncbi:MAG: polymer-forming cytoskeletal protein [candidate division WOR-3 bacterium]|nr:polymer-forming cytoskeletal protein [candidate division WOR-3 bacterium]